MKETGIIMSGNHPKLILDGIKTQTRRTYGLSLINDPPQSMADWQLVSVFQVGCARFATPNGNGDVTLVCPYGGYGDRLWVRETWAYQDFAICTHNHIPGYRDKEGWSHPVVHKAGKENYAWGLTGEPKWRSSRFMPQRASRITLEIAEVRVERVQEITYQDAKAEGILRFDGEHPEPDTGGMGYNRGAIGLPMRYESTAAFMDLWDSLNAKRGYGWETNPWAWVINFRVKEGECT